MAALWRSPWTVISPAPRAPQAARGHKLNAQLVNGTPEYSAKMKGELAKTIPPGQKIRRPLSPPECSSETKIPGANCPLLPWLRYLTVIGALPWLPTKKGFTLLVSLYSLALLYSATPTK